jgi:hypothetical protein
MSKQRKKSSKIKGWAIHTQASFTKENDENTYIERATFKIHMADKMKANNSDLLAFSVANWIGNVKSENNYNPVNNVKVEKFIPIRS